MDKQTLNTVSVLVAEEAINKPKKNESFEDYVKRVYPEFEKFVSDSSNSVISEIAKDSKDALKNAISKLEARRMLVKRYCQVNDPFGIQPPKEATVQEILEHNGVKGSEKELKGIMGEDAFNAYIDKLRTPKKDGLTQTEINRKEEEHYAQYEPAFPSEKTYDHGSGGSTRSYHWQSSLQDSFLEDHIKFLETYGIEDGFPEIEEDETEAENKETASDEQE